MIKKTDGGVTAAKGFEAIGIAAGIKKGKKDMALITAGYHVRWPVHLRQMS